MPGDALDVFISYSHEDRTLWRELEEQLVLLRREGLIGTWHERRITAGEEWRGWIDRDLMSADLILLILSAPFLESDYCKDAEVKHALKLQALGHAKVMPIIARPCDWRTAPFAKLATLPQGVGPVTEWHSRDSAWEDVAQGIREVAKRLMTARLESTAEYRIAVRSPARETDRRAAPPPPQEVSEAGTPRSVILGRSVAILTAFAVILFLVVRWQQRSEDGAAQVSTAEVKPPGAISGQDSFAADPPAPAAATAIEHPPAPPPVATPSEAEPDPAPAARAGAIDRLPEELPPPEVETAPDELSPVAVEILREHPSGATDTEPAEPATAVAEEDAPEPATGPRKPEDFERTLGILTVPGEEGESGCLAVLIGDDHALTSKACALASSVIVMGGNALTATRDEIFDIDPQRASQATGINIVRLLQGLGETYGFVSTGLEESFDYESLDAHYVEASTIRRVECAAVARLADADHGGHAYVEDAAFDRYVSFVEEAAGEAISLAGARWAAVLPEVLDSATESLAGFGCRLPNRPPGNLVFSAEGRVVGIGYPCEPFDRMEAEVRDGLPDGIRQLDLDCIASLSDIREHL